jgi:carbonic anhydrase
MMPDKVYKDLLAGNKRFVDEAIAQDPKFFDRLANTQAPKVLWIGCADSRVPANQITSTLPGEIFVHRNIANVVVHTDMNCLSVIEYAVNVLQVEHVIVCGHYGCGGVKASMDNCQYGNIDNWLRHIKDVYRLHLEELEAVTSPEERFRLLVELNVREQVYNVCKTSMIQNSWRKRKLPHVHGWVYDIANGVIKDLNVNIKDADDLGQVYRLHAKALA